MDSFEQKQDFPKSKPQMNVGEDVKISQNVKSQHGEQRREEQHGDSDSYRNSLEEYRSPISGVPYTPLADCDWSREAAPSSNTGVSPDHWDEHDQTPEVSSKCSQSDPDTSKQPCKNKNTRNRSKLAEDKYETHADVSKNIDSEQTSNISEHSSGVGNIDKYPGGAVRVNSSETDGAKANMYYSNVGSWKKEDGGQSRHSDDTSQWEEKRYREVHGDAGSNENSKSAEPEFTLYQCKEIEGHERHLSGGSGHGKYTGERDEFSEVDRETREGHKGRGCNTDLAREGHKGNGEYNKDWTKEGKKGNREYDKDRKGTGGHDQYHAGGRGRGTAKHTRGGEGQFGSGRGNNGWQKGAEEHNAHQKGNDPHDEWQMVGNPHGHKRKGNKGRGKHEGKREWQKSGEEHHAHQKGNNPHGEYQIGDGPHGQHKRENKGHDKYNKGDKDGRGHHSQHKVEEWHDQNQKGDGGYNNNQRGGRDHGQHKGGGRATEPQKGHRGNNHLSSDKSEYGKDGSAAKSMGKDENVLDMKKEALKKAMNYVTHDNEGEDEDEENLKKRAALSKYVYFWRDRDIYSQWYKSKFLVNGVKFFYAEQFMMYKKAELFEDWKIMHKVLKADHPRQMKSLGRQVQNFSDEMWAHNCLHIVKEANIAKFSQDDYLKKELFSTYPKVLVEASPYDRIWGIGLMKDWPDAWNKSTWNGKNLLGYIITEVRDELMCDAGKIREEDRLVYLEDLKKELLEEQAKKISGTSVDDGFSFGRHGQEARQSDTSVEHTETGAGVTEAEYLKEYKDSSARNENDDIPEWFTKSQEQDKKADFSDLTKTSEDLSEQVRSQEQGNTDDDVPLLTVSNRYDEKEKQENDVSEVVPGSLGSNVALGEAGKYQVHSESIPTTDKFKQEKDSSLLPGGSGNTPEDVGIDSENNAATSDEQNKAEGALDLNKTVHLSDVEVNVGSFRLDSSEDINTLKLV